MLVSVQWGNWLIFLNDQNQGRPVFSVLEVVFVQTGHDHCVITLIAHHTDHNLYCWSWSLSELFLGPTLTIMNLLMTPCGGLTARNTEDTWWHVWQWDKYSAIIASHQRRLIASASDEKTLRRITCNILNHLPIYPPIPTINLIEFNPQYSVRIVIILLKQVDGWPWSVFCRILLPS